MVKVKREHIDAMRKIWDEPICLQDEDDSDRRPTKRAKLSATASASSAPPAPVMVKLKTVKDRDIEAHGLGVPSRPKPADPKAPPASKVIANDQKIPSPSKDLTDLDKHVTTICANVSQQIYHATDKSYFQFDQGQDVQVLCYDDHDTLDPAIPAFAILAVEDKIILAWRGSQNPLDFVTDIAISPVISPAWGQAGSGMRGQGMYCALVASDVAKHEATITDYLRDRNNQVREVILTGHSLGGGMANIAHVLIRAKLDNEYQNRASKWSGLKNRLTCRTLAFEPPMTMFDYDEMEVENEISQDLLERVAENTRTIVFGCDVVPRGYAHMHYIRNVVDEVLPELFYDKLPFGIRLGSGALAEWVTGKIFQNLQGVTEVAAKFRHLGKILYYPADGIVQPLVITDQGPAPSQDPSHLSYYTYQSYKIPKRDNVDSLYDAHLHFPERMASYISVDANKH